MHGQAYLTSAEHAAAVGPFDGFALNREPMLRVMEMHRDAVEAIDPACPAVSARTRPATSGTKCLDCGRQSRLSATARSRCSPRPARSLHDGLRHDGHRARHRAGEVQATGRRRHAQDRQPAPCRWPCKKLGYDEPTIEAILDYIDEHDTIEGAPGLKPTSTCRSSTVRSSRANGGRSIHLRAHVRMMAAVQPFLSGAISKTFNMPSDATVDDIGDAYLEGWQLGPQGPGHLSRRLEGEPAGHDQAPKATARRQRSAVAGQAAPRAPARHPAVASPTSSTSRATRATSTSASIPTAGPASCSSRWPRKARTIGGLMDVLGTAISMGLQYGVPLEVFVNKFAHSRFEPAGFTKNPDIPIAKSIADYIFRWLGMEFIPGYHEAPRRPQPQPAAVPHPEDDADTQHRPAAMKAGGLKQSDIKSRKTTSETESSRSRKQS